MDHPLSESSLQGAYFVIFASGKNKSFTNFHTDFSLSASVVNTWPSSNQTTP